MVRTHPETGRKSLFLGRRINAYVIGLPEAESEELLDELWAHMVQEKFTWTQEWQVGDLVWWDNRCAMHRRDAFDPSTRRLMHRTQLKGTRPV
jgi:taurine dioxygenase